MLAHQRRARWIRRMQQRAARRRDRVWARRAGAFGPSSLWPGASGGGSRAA